MTARCGYLIKGDPSRPCVRVLGHNNQHRDARQEAQKRRGGNPETRRAYQRAYQKQYRADYPERHTAAKSKYYKANKDACLERHREWVAANPEKVQSWEDANRDRRNELQREWNRTNRAARLETERRYRERHPEKTSEKYRRHSRRRKSKLRGIYHEDWTRQQVIAKYGDCCYLCGGAYEETDHVIPLAKGGWDVLANLRPACTVCNQRKRDKILPVVAVAIIYLVLSQVGFTWSDA
jgi:hypothetical protein